MPAKFTIHDREIAAVLQGVKRCGIRTYCRVAEDGSTYVVPIRAQLVALGMAPKVATDLIREADLPVSLFSPNEPAEPPEPELDPKAIMLAALEAAAKEEERE